MCVIGLWAVEGHACTVAEGERVHLSIVRFRLEEKGRMGW